MTRMMARMMALDVQERPTPEQMAFWRRAGMPPDLLAQRAAAIAQEKRGASVAEIRKANDLG